ncbi:hypothetical protein D3C85_984280 [compost metagenome]
MTGDYRYKIRQRPKFLQSGAPYAALPLAFNEQRHELAVSVAFATDRKLFGEVYSCLQPDYFWDMPRRSGVFVRPVVQTSDLSRNHTKPGDIDLLIIPYEEGELILHRVLAVEIKIIRAKYARQGKSPNDFGVSQATALRDMGFPYVGLLHLIVSDDSPEHAWQEVQRARVIDKKGTAEWLAPARIDTMPMNLIHRAFGRLESRQTWPELGLAAAYVLASSFCLQKGLGASWQPQVSPAERNEMSLDLLSSVGEYFDANASSFLDNPRFDPA